MPIRKRPARSMLVSTVVMALLSAGCDSKPARSALVDNYWKAVGPLVAGNYRGSCLRSGATRSEDGTITVAADGTASSGDLRVDISAANMAGLNRMRDDQGQYTTVASFAAGDAARSSLSLMAGPDGTGNDAKLERGELALTCGNIAGGAALNARPLYQALGPMLGGKQAVVCDDIHNPMLIPAVVDVMVDDSVIRFGASAFDMNTAMAESYTFDRGRGRLLLNIILQDRRTIGLAYDGAGKLVEAKASANNTPTHRCSAQG